MINTPRNLFDFYMDHLPIVQNIYNRDYIFESLEKNFIKAYDLIKKLDAQTLFFSGTDAIYPYTSPFAEIILCSLYSNNVPFTSNEKNITFKPSYEYCHVITALDSHVGCHLTNLLKFATGTQNICGYLGDYVLWSIHREKIISAEKEIKFIDYNYNSFDCLFGDEKIYFALHSYIEEKTIDGHPRIQSMIDPLWKYCYRNK